MTDQELNTWIATHIMGWELLPFNWYHGFECGYDENEITKQLGDDNKIWFVKGKDDCAFYAEYDGPMGDRAFSPTKDLNACREAEMKMEEYQRKHYEGVMSALSKKKFMDPKAGSFWMMTATARQRCEAIYKVVEVE